MRILGHIHTFNDEDVIERAIQSLLAQTWPLSEIVVVDNGSTDNTLNILRQHPVTVIRHDQNLGTSGSVVSGMGYGIDHAFDWIWLFDADTSACADALEKLVVFYRQLPAETQTKVWLLSSVHVERNGHRPYYQATFSAAGFRNLGPDARTEARPFDSTIWSGSLYKLDTVKSVGLPSLDYVLDWGEHEYGYRGKRHGHLAFVVEESVVRHNIGDEGPALGVTRYGFGPLSITVRELPAIRCYYLTRNLLYFWLYEYHERRFRSVLVCLLRVGKLTCNFVLRAAVRPRQALACVRGVRDGLFKHMQRRY